MLVCERGYAAVVAQQGAWHSGPLPPQGCRLKQPVCGDSMAAAAAAAAARSLLSGFSGELRWRGGA
jgi:hypothetical protein